MWSSAFAKATAGQVKPAPTRVLGYIKSVRFFEQAAVKASLLMSMGACEKLGENLGCGSVRPPHGGPLGNL